MPVMARLKPKRLPEIHLRVFVIGEVLRLRN
jgi:hypothetical protein